jgi:hypothetical protein
VIDLTANIIAIETGIISTTGTNDVILRPKCRIRAGRIRLPADMDIPLNV